MTPSLIWTLYIFFALAQAILAMRYVFPEGDRRDPVAGVVVMTIFAPLTTAGLLIYGFRCAVIWLVTYRTNK